MRTAPGLVLLIEQEAVAEDSFGECFGGSCVDGCVESCDCFDSGDCFGEDRAPD